MIHRLHRQMGLVNQTSIAKMQITMSGSCKMIGHSLIQLEALGACQIGQGQVSIDVDPHSLVSPVVSWSLGISESINHLDLVKQLADRGMEVQLGRGKGVHFHFQDSEFPDAVEGADIFLMQWGGAAAVETNALLPLGESKPTLIDRCLDVMLAATAAHLAMRWVGAIRSEPIVDRWLTLTLRMEGVEPEEAIQRISSPFGNPTATALDDSEGSLVRIRIPLDETPGGIMDFVEHDCHEPWRPEPDFRMDVGPLKMRYCNGRPIGADHDIPESIQMNTVILGAGGLGSWASMAMMGGLADESEIHIVDSDLAVDIHNLNRQVLYSKLDLGLPKAVIAEQRLRELRPEIEIHGHVDRLDTHHVYPTFDIEGDLSLEDLVGSDSVLDSVELNDVLNSMEIGFACLDNQAARTLLNTLCIQNEIPMINGASEAMVGIVEILDNDVCMVCRYGIDEAWRAERVSCTETGTRPVASIVTTTAWTGAAQAAFGLLKHSGLAIDDMRVGAEWDSGFVKTREVTRLPWHRGSCEDHLKPHLELESEGAGRPVKTEGDEET
ncbi:MAG: ThiF family adenylyltransferase [Candidatus Thermoplasmatota archaeon]|nr:ThiF family adenylyltransferase [Candidatus Thermoplasmatota archaeon]